MVDLAVISKDFEDAKS